MIAATLAQPCLDATTRKTTTSPKVMWTSQVEGAITISPAIAGRLIFVTTEAGNFYAINKQTGERLWTYVLPSDANQPLFFSTQPLLYENLVIVGTNARNCTSTDRGNVYAFDQQTGKLRWKLGVPGVVGNFAMLDDSVIFGTGQDEWDSLDLQSGRLRWSFRSPNNHVENRCLMHSSPVTDGVSVFLIGDDRMLYGLDGKTGSKSWQKEWAASATTEPFMYKDVAYFGAADGHVYGLNPASGEMLVKLDAKVAPVEGFIWGGQHDNEREFSFGLKQNGQHTRLLLAYGDEFESVLWSQSSATQWTLPTPYYWRDTVLTGNCNGKIVAYRADSGQASWTSSVSGCVSSFGGDNSMLLVGVKEGKLYSLVNPAVSHSASTVRSYTQ